MGQAPRQRVKTALIKVPTPVHLQENVGVGMLVLGILRSGRGRLNKVFSRLSELAKIPAILASRARPKCHRVAGLHHEWKVTGPQSPTCSNRIHKRWFVVAWFYVTHTFFKLSLQLRPAKLFIFHSLYKNYQGASLLLNSQCPEMWQEETLQCLVDLD